MTHHGRAAYRWAIEQGDGQALAQSFAENAKAYVPVGHEPIRGPHAIAGFIGALGQILQDFRYTYQGASEDGMVLEFEALVPPPPGSTAHAVALNAIDLLIFDDEDRIVRFTGVARPRQALDALLAHGLGQVYDEALLQSAPAETEPEETVGSLSRRYFEALRARNAEGLMECLAEECGAIGPIGAFRETKTADAFVTVLRNNIWPATEDYVLRALVANEDEGFLAYDWVTKASPEPIRIAVHHRYARGRIQAIELFFDPTPFVAASAAPGS